jgi:hypothetical protein
MAQMYRIHQNTTKGNDGTVQEQKNLECSYSSAKMATGVTLAQEVST